jgi:xylitol oxidase
MPSAGNELQSEYFIPISNAVEVINIIDRLADLIAPYLYVSEIRTVAPDEFWMSPCYRQSITAFHFTWKNDWAAVSKILPVIENELIPLGAHPHWGKLFTMAAEAIAPCYERWHDFKNIVSFYDPEKKFRNEFLNQYIFGLDD